MTSRRFFSLPHSSFHSESGQVAVVILLLMVVILTVGISVASRTTQELITSKQTSDSARVFNAAETGIDEALSTLESSFESGNLDPNGTITVNNTDVNYQISPSQTLQTRVDEGVSVMVALVDQTVNPNGLGAGGSRRLQIQWSDSNLESDCTTTPGPASLLVFIYSMNGGTAQARMKAVQGCNHSDGFDSRNATAGSPFRYRHDVDLAAGDVLVRVKPMYNDTQLAVSGSGLVLPTQNFVVTAEARNQQGGETSKIRVDRTLPTAPSVLDYALYSGTTINKSP